MLMFIYFERNFPLMHIKNNKKSCIFYDLSCSYKDNKNIFKAKRIVVWREFLAFKHEFNVIFEPTMIIIWPCTPEIFKNID